ncbi:hypothetical protein PHLGIDRAFT_35252 [Phlebiopsis gigantea 11061_1 CR5-6]|uniref:Transcription elongation factor n=1 Tax=Phlebiopsis gigantea (strain 11061_1 CR5-6) TaxID=745531 RepID=A0A0C3NRT4_PHLG1|nr:hypothetical protein PHLGIDRAFT_35252 [Phlebiopsis gigantea 11061_1 CR5-6]
MSPVSELRSLVKQLQSSPTEQDVLATLQTLKDLTGVTEAILRESKAGLAVGKLRSHASRVVSDLAKEIVKKWKQQVEHEKQTGGKSPTTNASSRQPLRKQSTASAQVTTPTTASSTSAKPSAAGAKSDVRTAKSDGISLKMLSDATRDKCLELIYDALAFDSGAPAEQILSKAKAIESTVLNDNDGVTVAYKSKIRTLFVNLKDKNNPGLRESVVSGDIPVARLCKMTSSDMASEERKAADQKIQEENLFKTLGAGESQAETDAFQCGRCKQRKCRYRQAQTRSADEPMTTFVTCTVCNNRWKFS